MSQSEATVTASVFSFGPITLKRTPEGRIQIFIFDSGVELEVGEVAMLRDWMNVEAPRHTDLMVSPEDIDAFLAASLSRHWPIAFMRFDPLPPPSDRVGAALAKLEAKLLALEFMSETQLRDLVQDMLETEN